MLVVASSAAAGELEVVDLAIDRVEGSRVPVRLVIENRSKQPARGALCIFSWKGQEWGRLSDRSSIRPGEKVYLDGVLARPQDHRGPVPDLAVAVSEFHLPDLTVERVTVPEVAPRNGPLDVLVWVRNDGAAEAAGPRLTLKAGEQVLQEKQVFDVLAPGRSQAYTLRWVPESEGRQELTVLLDASDAIEELHEDNNRRSVTLEVGPARGSGLTVTAFTINTEQPRAGLPVKASVSVTNRGRAVVYEVPLVVRAGGHEVRSYTFREPLAPNQTGLFRVSWIAAEAGEQLYTVSAEPEAPESFKNVRARSAVTVLPAPVPDLKVTQLEVPSRVEVGRECRLVARVMNEGELRAEGCKLRLVSDQGQTVLVPQRFEIGAGQSAAVPFEWIPRHPGEVVLELTALSEGALQEADTSDNQLSVTVQVEPGK